MSPQFVDFNADGQLDIVAGTFDGSPHVAWGSAKGWNQPEQILDRDGARIVINQFWNFDSKKWDSTKRCDPQDVQLAEGHLTSAWAVDWDGDGDLDLLLGDHTAGYVYLRVNEGATRAPAFATRNRVLLCEGKPLKVEGTVATLQVLDWNGDGQLDLLCSSMGDAYSDKPGGGVFLYPGIGTSKAPALGAPITLVAISKKGGHAPTRPDSGLYAEAFDHDGDGDLDLLVGGYSHWVPPAIELTEAQSKHAAELRASIEALDKENQAFFEEIQKAVEGLGDEAANKKRTELYEARREELATRSKRRTALQDELEALVPGPKRQSFVWLYENTTAPAVPADGTRR
ncbi:MAG: FG-GAP-like repeat-containing protein [Planctomycetota bacterium]